jgi:hypothetical protein
VSRSLFKDLPWFLLPVGQYCFVILGSLLLGILFTCCILFLLYSSNLSKIGVIFNSFAICVFLLQSVQMYPAVLLSYLWKLKPSEIPSPSVGRQLPFGAACCLHLQAPCSPTTDWRRTVSRPSKPKPSILLREPQSFQQNCTSPFHTGQAHHPPNIITTFKVLPEVFCSLSPTMGRRQIPSVPVHEVKCANFWRATLGTFSLLAIIPHVMTASVVN